MAKGVVINYWSGEGGGGGRAGKFWKRAAIFWAPTWGGLKFSERLWAMCAY